MGNGSKRQDIIEASTRVFPRVGYHAATVEDILVEAEIARSTFYVYFSNKREVFTRVVSGMIEEVLGRIHKGIDSIIEELDIPSGKRPNDQLVEDALVDLMFDVFSFVVENRGMARIFLHELVGIDGDMTRLFYDFQEKLTDEFERLVRVGVEIGYLRNVNQRRATEYIVGGLIHLARIISAGMDEYDIEDASKVYVDLQLHGLVK